MKFIKKNIKILVGFIVGVILASGISVYATYKYFATDVSYTKDGTEMSVTDALNELYTIKKDYILPSGTKTISINGEFDVAEFEKVIVEGFDCLVMENFQMQASSSAIHYNIGFNPRLVFMVTSDNKFYWGIGNNQYWYVSSSDCGCMTGTFNVGDNGFSWLSHHDRDVTLYAIK